MKIGYARVSIEEQNNDAFDESLLKPLNINNP